MNRLFFFVLLGLALALLPGCGGDKDKGMNSPDKRKDLPRAAPSEPAK